jgi:dihydrofolate reductase
MKAIVAMDPNRVIGCKGKLPWTKNKDDMAFFKRMTENNVLVMGRSTYESVGNLPKRFTYVLTNHPQKLSTDVQSQAAMVDRQGLHHVYITGKQLIEMCQKYPGRTSHFWLCGGAKVYQQFLPLCSEIYVTHIFNEYEGDAYMPEFEHLFTEPSIVLETKEFTIAKYWKGKV